LKLTACEVFAPDEPPAANVLGEEIKATAG
jgi:hypothetical protein